MENAVSYAAPGRVFFVHHPRFSLIDAL